MNIANEIQQTLFESGETGEGQWENKGRGELVQGTLYTRMELSQ
jgi:hypothetical protein